MTEDSNREGDTSITKKLVVITKEEENKTNTMSVKNCTDFVPTTSNGVRGSKITVTNMEDEQRSDTDTRMTKEGQKATGQASSLPQGLMALAADNTSAGGGKKREIGGVPSTPQTWQRKQHLKSMCSQGGGKQREERTNLGIPAR